MISDDLGNRIQKLRKEKGLTQTAFGEIFGLSQNQITNIERGKSNIDFETLVRISKYFSVTTDYLLGVTSASKVLNSENNIKIREVCDYTGLEESSILNLIRLKIPFDINFMKGDDYAFNDYADFMIFINFFISDNKILYKLMDEIGEYKSLFIDYKLSVKAISDEISKHDIQNYSFEQLWHNIWSNFSSTKNISRQIKYAKYDIDEVIKTFTKKYIDFIGFSTEKIDEEFTNIENILDELYLKMDGENNGNNTETE